MLAKALRGVVVALALCRASVAALEPISHCEVRRGWRHQRGRHREKLPRRRVGASFHSLHGEPRGTWRAERLRTGVAGA